jgi:transposase
MQVVYERCCGLDVHKDTVAACIAITGGGRVHRDKRVFGTTTKELLDLSDWLAEHSITHVGMESTGVYLALSSALFGRVQVPLALG